MMESDVLARGGSLKAEHVGSIKLISAYEGAGRQDIDLMMYFGNHQDSETQEEVTAGMMMGGFDHSDNEQANLIEYRTARWEDPRMPLGGPTKGSRPSVMSIFPSTPGE